VYDAVGAPLHSFEVISTILREGENTIGLVRGGASTIRARVTTTVLGAPLAE
jgi:hypothetical protein